MNVLKNFFVLAAPVNNDEGKEDATAEKDTLPTKIKSDVLQPLEEILEQTLTSKMAGCVLRPLGALLRQLTHNQAKDFIQKLKDEVEQSDLSPDPQIEKLRNK
jgi:hypothetical protein